jgi:hypothetical protein
MRACIVSSEGGGRRKLATTDGPSAREHWLYGSVGHGDGARCDDSCNYLSKDGECDDGGEGSLFFFCEHGTE